jgi:Zn-dependent protease with chaperone function
MIENKNLDIYLKRLNENEDLLVLRIIMNLVITILIAVITIWVYTSQPKNRKISAEIYKVTGKKYPVIILEDTIPNAFCFGGIGKSIFVTQGLIDICTEREVIAVCLHEIGHIVNFDTIKSSLVGIGGMGAE